MKRIVLALALVMLAACGPDQKATDNLAAAKTFLATNGKAAGIVTLPSGLQYKIIQSGPATGAKPHNGDEVKVHYEGKLLDGKVFDSSYERGAPAAMPIDALIPAWIEALQLMRPGDVWMLYVPPELGYGEEGAGGGEIPGNSVLIFKIELIGVLPGPGSIGQG
ncbi:FKBP-type peptidyl-prolyl cis-trans isomerase [Phenylobacterium sp.]|uniref:FKBP-type peptidyl-prolyl cis-trans isomerase n=1 Tax=Phenylobacterium sp. TaxID=1871053 RepID=UPI0030F3FFC9